MSIEVSDLLEPVSELVAVKPELYARLMGSEAVTLSIPESVVLSSD